MTIFKNMRNFVLLACVGVLTLASTSVLALEGSSSTTDTPKAPHLAAESRQTQSSQKRCQPIDKIASRIQSQLAKRQSKVEAKRTALSAKVTSRQEHREDQLATKRTEWDAKRQQSFDKLHTKAKTEAQKQAVEEYVTAMHSAIATRRVANDQVFATFRSDLANLKQTLGQSVEQSITATATETNRAVASAKASCESGQKPSAVKQTLKSELKAIQASAKTARHANTKAEQIKIIVQKRNDAIRVNADTFKATTEQARQKLRSAFSS